MNELDLMALWTGAARYYLGRQTSSVSTFCQLLVQEWPSLPASLQNLLQRDIEEQFARDDEDRKLGRETRALGADVDRMEWTIVRNQWRGLR